MSMHLEAITKLPEFMKLVTHFYKSSNSSHVWWSHHNCSYSIIKCHDCYCPTNVSFKSHFPLCFYSLYPLVVISVQPLPLFFLPLKPIHLPKKAALFHFLFNVIGTTFFYDFPDSIFIIVFLTFRFYIPISPRLQLAFIHGFFNIVTTLLNFSFL